MRLHRHPEHPGLQAAACASHAARRFSGRMGGGPGIAHLQAEVGKMEPVA